MTTDHQGGAFADGIGRAVNMAYELRQRGDYREYVELTRDQVGPFIEKARRFIEGVRTYLKRKSLI